MKCLRSLVLLVCLVPFCVVSGPVHGSQASTGGTPAVSKAKPAASKAVSKALPTPTLDLSLPANLVDKLEPEVDDAPLARKPVLPAMFTESPSTDSPFQLNGRLISNEMDLQLRNDSRRDVEGAAIDFEFRQ